MQRFEGDLSTRGRQTSLRNKPQQKQTVQVVLVYIRFDGQSQNHQTVILKSLPNVWHIHYSILERLHSDISIIYRYIMLATKENGLLR